MLNLKNLLVCILCFSATVISADVAAQSAGDFDGYYILRVRTGTFPNPDPDSRVYVPPGATFSVGKWVDNDSGNCPGIAFPETLPASPDSTKPTPENEIKIDPKTIAFPYNCYTTYVANIHIYNASPYYKDGSIYGQETCMVGVRLKVVAGGIERVHLMAINGSGHDPIYPECKHTPEMPFITL